MTDDMSIVQEPPAKKAKKNKQKVKRIKHTVKDIAARLAAEKPFNEDPAGTFDVLDLKTIECTVCQHRITLSDEGNNYFYHNCQINKPIRQSEPLGRAYKWQIRQKAANSFPIPQTLYGGQEKSNRRSCTNCSVRLIILSK